MYLWMMLIGATLGFGMADYLAPQGRPSPVVVAPERSETMPVRDMVADPLDDPVTDLEPKDDVAAKDDVAPAAKSVAKSKPVAKKDPRTPDVGRVTARPRTPRPTQPKTVAPKGQTGKNGAVKNGKNGKNGKNANGSRTVKPR